MRSGYFLNHDLEEFDSAFFGINTVEALHMDAQQRMLLEVVYECFESGGVRLDHVAGANVGCFVGNFTTDNQIMQARDWEYSHRYTATGIGATILSNRISHIFDLKGPSLTIDTACSSSLYCLHFACRSIQQGDCDSAIVAAANLIQAPEQYISTAAAGVLSKTGTCHTFDADADGYGRADAIGSLYLKRLSDAIRDNDPIRSIVRGSAINANGRTPGITMPSPIGQEAVIAQAYQYSGIHPADTSYVECHGTGTPVGDPIEVAAVASFYKQHSPLDSNLSCDPLLVGSVKSNFGHSEAASGITSVIKTTLALEHRQIPATVGIQQLNTKIPWKEHNIDVVQSLISWPKSSGQIPTAGVNSFGYGGANSHCILQGACCRHEFKSQRSNESVHDHRVSDRGLLIPVSAKSSNAVLTRIKNLVSIDLAEIIPSDLAYTLAERRTFFDWRGYWILTPYNLVLDTIIQAASNTIRQSLASDIPLAFVFSGQGAQWPQMGGQLIERYTSFYQTLSDLEQHLQQLPEPPSWSLREAILASPADSRIHDPLVSQTACTAIQIALIDLLRSWNILPSFVIGHSSGEIAAAYAAGILSAFEAIGTAYVRGRVLSSTESSGAMIAVGLSSDEAGQRIRARDASHLVSVACINSPKNVTISGDANTIEMLLQSLEKEGIFVRKLKTGGKAYHSSQMVPVGETYEMELSAIFQHNDDYPKSSYCYSPTQQSPLMISTVYNQPITRKGFCGPSYWRANLESPVKFGPSIETILGDQDCQFIEIGPHSTLEMPVKQTKQHLKKEDNTPYLTALRRGKDSEVCMLSLVGDLWTLGYAINFSAINGLSENGAPDNHSVLTDLPNYPWDHSEKLWKEPRSSYEFRHRRYPRDDLLGSLVPGSNGLTSTWRNLLSMKEVLWLQDHRLANDAVFPAAGFVALASRAAQQLASSIDNCVLEIRNMHITEAMVLPLNGQVELFTELVPRKYTDLEQSSSEWHFTISTFDVKQSRKHASGDIAFISSQDALGPSRLAATKELSSQHRRVWYSRLSQVGMNFGPKFHSLSDIFIPRMKNVMVSKASLAPLPEDVEDEHSALYPFEIHPIALDAQLQSGLIACAAGDPEKLVAQAPAFIERVQIWPGFQHRTLAQCTVESSSRTVGFGMNLLGSEMLDANRKLISRFCNVKAALFHGSLGEKQIRHPMLRVQWQPDISKLNGANFSAFKAITQQYNEAVKDESINIVSNVLHSVLKLLSHGSGEVDVLQLGDFHKAFILGLMDSLGACSPFQRYRHFSWGRLDAAGHIGWSRLERNDVPDDPPPVNITKSSEPMNQLFDIVICSDSHDLDLVDINLSSFLTNYLKPSGKLLVLGKMESKTLEHLGCQSMELLSGTTIPVTLAFPDDTLACPEIGSMVQSSGLVLVVSNPSHPLNLALARNLGVDAMSLQDVSLMDVPKNSTVILTAELENPVLSTASERQFASIQNITNHASKVLWVTGGNLAKSQKPDSSIVFGLARTLMAEQPSLKISVVDVDDPCNDVDLTISNLFAVLEQERTCTEPVDHEYLQKAGVLHVSRLIADHEANSIFHERKTAQPLLKPLGEIRSSKLSIQEPGQMDTLYFTPNPDVSFLRDDDVEVQIKAVGVNAKDLYTLSGKIETIENTCCCEFSGVVVRVGNKVCNFAIGDRVLVNAPSHFGTYEQVPAWACCKIHDYESFTQMAAVSTVFMTAVFGLREIARLRPNESVLVHSAAGGVGIAAILLAKDIGARVFATVGTEEKKAYLAKNFSLDPGCIFNSRDTSFLSQVMRATDNKGVDVVLNSLTGNKLHASLNACAKFGRFVEIGKRDILDAGQLGMRIFERCITFSAFDLHELYYSKLHQRKYGDLIQDAVALYRKVSAPAPIVFGVDEISAAFRLFSKGTRIGKIVVSFEDCKSLVLYKSPKFLTTFSAEKSYLLVGCLGGLGRSIARYMLFQGARHFTFMGRSGADKAVAASLVEDLKHYGAEVTVVRGDVQDYSTVEAAISLMKYPLGGVVQTAMALAESLFTSMTHLQWSTVLGPKVQGTWNIHRAISGKEQDLDFFLMTSSLSGSVVSPTEGNYCAANCFLDYFAAYRRSLGLPATSLGLGQINGVGYLYEHPDIEQMLARRGVTDLTEDDMLLFIDMALHSRNSQGSVGQTDAHIITGMEATRMGEMWDQGYELSLEMFRNDPRFNIFALATPKSRQAQTRASSAKPGLPQAVDDALASKDSIVIQQAVFNVLAERLSHLILVPVEKISPHLRLFEIGMDSMLAAEYRTFIFRSLHVDVPFLTLIDSKSKKSDITSRVCSELL